MSTQGSTTEKPSRFRWVVAGLFFLVYTVASADRANLGVALPFIREEYPMTNAEAGALLSVFLLAYALAQIPSGFASSRFGVRKIFSFSMIATSVFTALMGTVNSVLALKIYRFALGLAEGPLPIGIASTINQWFPAKEKGTATGIFLAAVKFGPVIVPPLCVAIVAMWGWREIFYIFAVPGILLSIAWYFLVANQPAQSRFVNAGELAHITDETNNVITQKTEGAQRHFKRLDRFIRVRQLAPIATSRGLFKSWNVVGCALSYSFQVGITMVLLLLGLAAIPRDPIEAARVDGASSGQIFRHIIWPLLLPTVLVVTILNVAAGFTTFDLLWVMAGDYPGKRTLSLAVYMYYESFSNGSWAYGSAVAVVLGAMVIAVSAALAVLQSRVEKSIR